MMSVQPFMANLASVNTFQPLLGKLLYFHICVTFARIFANGILQLFRKNSHKKSIILDNEFEKDLSLFIQSFPAYNSVTYIVKQQLQENETLYIDACLTGMGLFGVLKYTPPQYLLFPSISLNIANLEMLNNLTALRVWADQRAHKEVLFLCNNWASDPNK